MKTRKKVLNLRKSVGYVATKRSRKVSNSIEKILKKAKKMNVSLFDGDQDAIEIYDKIAGPLEDIAQKYINEGKTNEARIVYEKASLIYRGIGWKNCAKYCERMAKNGYRAKRLERIAS